MKSKIKIVSSALLTGLLLAGVLIGVTRWSGSATALPNASTLAELSAIQTQEENAFQVDATLLGEVVMEWGATGTFTNTWTEEDKNSLANSDTISPTIDISFLLQKGENDAVTGYVELQNTLVFTTQHNISRTTVSSGTGEITLVEVGPQSIGSYVGNQLNLTSERISYQTESGQEVQRQFSLTASPNQGSELLIGEYRETVWGLTLEPLTIGGTFQLRELKPQTRSANQSPVADPQTVQTTVDTAQVIMLTGSDADGNTLTFTITSDPIHGQLSGTAPNLTYTPETGFTGKDSFTFSVDDGNGGTASASVVVEVGNITNEGTPTPTTPEPGTTSTPNTPEPSTTPTPGTPGPSTTPDTTSLDDDNDSIPNKDEDINKDGDLTNDDTDNDGTPNYQDDDDDGDGALTIIEGSGDLNNNGTPDYLEKGVIGSNPDGRLFLPLSVK